MYRRSVGKIKPLKVLVLSHSSELGGAELSMIDLFDDWYNKGLVDPYFIVKGPVKNMGAELRKRNWSYYPVVYSAWSRRVPLERLGDIFRNAVYDTRAILEIEGIIKQIGPDVVMTNTLVAPWAAIAANLQKVPHVWFVREYGDLDHGHTMELGRRETFEDISYFSDLVVANSLTLQRHLEKYIEKSKLTTVYTPFDIDNLNEKSIEKSKSPFRHKGSLKLVITGKIKPQKGQAVAAEAVGRLVKSGENVELCVVGDHHLPDDIKPLKDAIDRYGTSDRVHLVGYQSNPYKYVKHADIGIMASTKEAFGRTTFEYLALGKPVIGANAGATPEMVIDNKTGFLYEPGSIDDMEMQIKRYLSDGDLLNRHSRDAAKKAQDMMGGENNSDSLFEKINKILQTTDPNQSHQMPHYVRKLIEYPGIGYTYMTTGSQESIPYQIYIRMRQLAKRVLVKVDKIIHKPGRRKYE